MQSSDSELTPAAIQTASVWFYYGMCHYQLKAVVELLLVKLKVLTGLVCVSLQSSASL